MIWSYLKPAKIKRAAQFCRSWICKRQRGRPHNSELQLSSLEVTKALTKILVGLVDKIFYNVTNMKITGLANISNMMLKVKHTVK